MRTIFVVLMLLTAARGYASLGGTVDSLNSKQFALEANSHTITHHPDYSVHEVDTGSSKIREYVNRSGIVFGIAWNGMRHPELSTLLGSFYFSDYQSASAKVARMRGARASSVRGEYVIVERWGHMRNVQGHAYDPALLPAGVNANEIR